MPYNNPPERLPVTTGMPKLPTEPTKGATYWLLYILAFAILAAVIVGFCVWGL